MRAVTKEEFKKLYFELGGGDETGWNLDYWNRFFRDNDRAGMKYLVEEPETPEHNRMMIVTECSAKEYRLSFLTEEAEDRLFDSPGRC